MKVWLRIPFSLLALLAMFATMMPGTVWACPMTGRIDAASRVCLGVMPSMSGEMPCAHMGGKCCKPLSVPASQADDDSGRLHVFAAANHVSFSFAFVGPIISATPLIVPSAVSFEAHAVRFYLACFANSPPSFWTSHRPVTLSGRAPPVF
jgi:hypothetical protein